MFFDALDKVKRGLCVCVFDGTDRLQHTFWRDIDEQHPARQKEARPSQRNVIEDLYRRMDDLVGRTVAQCPREDTLLMVISDHGFSSFRRGVDLNRWLEENGYLKVQEGQRNEKYLAGIDWSQHAGLCRRPGRHLPECQGPVCPGDCRTGWRSQPASRGNRRASRRARRPGERRERRQQGLPCVGNLSADRTRTPRPI